MTSTFSSPSPARSAALDSLRSLLTLLVVAHHAVLAYFLYAPPSVAFDEELIWGAFPIIDAARAPGVDALVLWNDSFFMALMFMLAGIFTGPSLIRKGTGCFLLDRFARIGLPFIVGAAVLGPLAYFPAYLQRASETQATGFVDAWLKLGVWPAGPVWFLWVLLAFGSLTAFAYVAVPSMFAALGRAGAWCSERPARLVALWTALALVAYVPVVVFVNPMSWGTWGPFFVQSSRVGLYAIYFLLGVALGWNSESLRNLMAQDGPLARRWVAWQVVAGITFVLFVAVVILSVVRMSRGEISPGLNLSASALMAVSGVLTSVSLLAWAARKRSVENAFWASLRRNAYGIFLVHYAVVVWLQYALLPVALPGLVKAACVTLAGIVISWGIAALLRRLPGLRAVL